MEVRFKSKKTIFDFMITAVAAVVSVTMMIYGVFHFGLKESWPELVLNCFYVICIAMMWMYFFKYRITSQQFNYWCTLNLGVTVLLRDILFPPAFDNKIFSLVCLTLAVGLIMMLTFFYARKDWKTYSKRNLWTICIVDMVIAVLYSVYILLHPTNEYTSYLLTEIWIRPTIAYGLVACFMKED